jgi:RteC protein
VEEQSDSKFICCYDLSVANIIAFEDYQEYVKQQLKNIESVINKNRECGSTPGKRIKADS